MWVVILLLVLEDLGDTFLLYLLCITNELHITSIFA